MHRTETRDTLTHTPAAPRGMTPPYLLVIEEGGSAVYVLPSRGAVVVGRGAEADLRLRDAAASRKHFAVAVDQGAISIADLGSHNGTRVNGERIGASRGLRSGDVVSI